MGNSKSQLSVPAPKKIIYFGVKAAGLPATMCLEVAGIEYEAQKVAMEEWKDLKPTTPTGVSGGVLDLWAGETHLGDLRGRTPR